MDIFVFSSRNLTNIWAGIGARLWAVSKSGPSVHQGRVTKAKSMRIGSFGILYCIDTQSLTTPFLVYSRPDKQKVVQDVWPEPWVLPFKIFPLGTPNKQLHKDRARNVLPVFATTKETKFSNIFHVHAVTVFSPTKIGSDDWEILFGALSD